MNWRGRVRFIILFGERGEISLIGLWMRVCCYEYRLEMRRKRLIEERVWMRVMI